MFENPVMNVMLVVLLCLAGTFWMTFAPRRSDGERRERPTTPPKPGVDEYAARIVERIERGQTPFN